ncbi:MAG: RluA family pseudouridine synthase, partial [Treponema sp.]|nr:RluA family pseudouridine synthase [Treponema sp.]
MILSFLSINTLRLDTFLREKLPALPELSGKDVSNSKIRRLILAGCVSVNGRQCTRPAFELRGRSTVAVNLDVEKFFFEKQPDDLDFVLTEKDVLFEDDVIIVVNKPAFLPVEQTITGNRKNLHDAVVDYLWKKTPSLRNPPYAGIMHRLDRETSGVILFTKTRGVNKAVHDMFENHTCQKTYHALVSETPAALNAGQNAFTVELPLGRVSASSQAAKWGVVPESKGGLYAKTTFCIIGPVSLKTEGGFKKAILLEAKPLTGRTHQIRVHS